MPDLPPDDAPLESLPALSLDLETTGLDVTRDRVVQVAAFRMAGGRCDDTPAIDVLVDPGVPISESSSRIHGIVDADVAGAIDAGEALDRLSLLLDGRVVIGHHVAFDLAVLRFEAARRARPWSEPPALDTAHLAAALEPGLPDLGLESVASWLGVSIAGRHTASGDSRGAAEIFAALLPRLSDHGLHTLTEARALSETRNDIRLREQRAGWYLRPGFEPVRTVGRAHRPRGARIALSAGLRRAAGLGSRLLGRRALARASTPVSDRRSAEGPPRPVVADRGPELSRTTAFTHVVRDHMSAVAVVCAADTPCRELVERMRDARVTSAIVTAGDDRPIGIVTEQDVVRRLAYRVGAGAPAREVMTSPVQTIHDGDYLFHGIAVMHRHGLRHMPVVDGAGRVVGVLELDKSVTHTARQMMDHIDRLSHEATRGGLQKTKAAQFEVALELLDEAVPAPEIQWLLSRINMDLHRQTLELCLAEMADEGRGGPPVEFDAIVMGSGGRGESFLGPDQDHGFLLADHPAEDRAGVDAWFEELAERLTRELEILGFPLCVGWVMATNPRWRKPIGAFKQQVAGWIDRTGEDALRYCDIFLDFRPFFGPGRIAGELRDFVTERATRPRFLRQLYEIDQGHRGALGPFRRLITDPNAGPNQGKIDLKTAGTLPLVGAVRLLSLHHGVAVTSTRGRIEALHRLGAVDDNEADYLRGAFEHITSLLLRQQLHDHRHGEPIGNHVPPSALTRRERDRLVDAYRAIQAFCERVGEVVAH